MFLMATILGKNAPKYGVQCKSCRLKICSKISAEILAKQNSHFCAFMLALSCIAQIGWLN
jgi:hypothetical protein